MAALSKEPGWPAIATPGSVAGTPLLRRTARLAAHLLGWPLLVKGGLLTGFALAAAVQHLLPI